MSAGLHGLAAARLGETDKALDFFHRTAAIDLSDKTAAIAGGVHIGALGGLWMTAIFGFAGVSFNEAGIVLAPALPIPWTRLAFAVQWRGRRVRCEIRRPARRVTLVLEAGAAMNARVGTAVLALTPDAPIEASF
ncbi:Alpha,alpha-trehalose phosphorylase [compost metagenome]